jgi:hypothetical protein
MCSVAKRKQETSDIRRKERKEEGEVRVEEGK